jgi:hypothetical protein
MVLSSVKPRVSSFVPTGPSFVCRMRSLVPLYSDRKRRRRRDVRLRLNALRLKSTPPPRQGRVIRSRKEFKPLRKSLHACGAQRQLEPGVGISQGKTARA